GSFIENPDLYTRGKAAGMTIAYTTAAVLGRHVVFNTAKPPFNDVRARRAVIQAFDMDGFINTLVKGASRKDYVISPPSPFHDPSTKWPTYDQAAAQKLFDQLAAEGKT